MVFPSSDFELARAPRLSGFKAVEFCSLDEVKFRHFGFGDSDVYVYPGITFYGICATPACPAFDREIDTPLANNNSKGHYGTFNLAIDSCDCFCRRCNKMVNRLTTCRFRLCKWNYKGLMQLTDSSDSESASPKRCAFKFHEGVANASNGCFEYQGHPAQWRFLEFVVQKLGDDIPVVEM